MNRPTNHSTNYRSIYQSQQNYQYNVADFLRPQYNGI